MSELQHRSLTADEAVRLHEALKSTPNILGYTVFELRRLTDLFVAEVDRQFAGVCVSVDLPQGWTEIAALYVLPEFRRSGLGRRLFRAAWEQAQCRRRHVYVLSRNPQVVSWMRELGMAVDDQLWRAPWPVQCFMARHLASRHRVSEGFRKRHEIARCPPLMQGIRKYPESN